VVRLYEKPMAYTLKSRSRPTRVDQEVPHAAFG
jgi:hypothetical protein